MTLLDWILLGILGLSMLLGAWRGLVFEVLSVFVWLIAFVLAQWFAPDVAAMLPMGAATQMLRYLAAFVLVFVATAFVAGLLVQLLTKLVSAMGLRPVDRTLGAVFGLLRGFILLLALSVVVSMTPWRQHELWQTSHGAVVLSQMLARFKPLLPQEFGKYLPA